MISRRATILFFIIIIISIIVFSALIFFDAFPEGCKKKVDINSINCLVKEPFKKEDARISYQYEDDHRYLITKVVAIRKEGTLTFMDISNPLSKNIRSLPVRLGFGDHGERISICRLASSDFLTSSVTCEIETVEEATKKIYVGSPIILDFVAKPTTSLKDSYLENCQKANVNFFNNIEQPFTHPLYFLSHHSCQPMVGQLYLL